MATRPMYHLENVPALTCLVTEAIPDPRKKKEKPGNAGNNTSSSTASGGFSSVSSHYAHQSSGPTTMTLLWFNKIKIAPDVQKHLAYPESCLIISEDGEGIGKMFTSVEVSSWAGAPCFLVHSGSYAKLSPEVDVGTSLTGFISPDLKVIQELGHEWSTFHGVRFDRKTFLSEENSGSSLFCRTTYKVDDVTKYDEVTSIPFIDLKTFVSESANILLLRLMIFEKKTGSITLKAINPRGVMVPVDYRILGRGIENVKGDRMEVFGIRRSLWSDNIQKAGITWDSVFNFYGRLVLRCQPEGNDHAMIPLWFRPVEEYDDFGQFSGIRPPIVWACDQELYSNYLVKKTELAAQYKTYLMDHPALRALLSDFLQKVLFSKPKDIFHFANNYFTPLLKMKQDSPQSSDCETTSSCRSDDEEEPEPKKQNQEIKETAEAEEEEDAQIMENVLQLHQKLRPLLKTPTPPPMAVELQLAEETEAEAEPPLPQSPVAVPPAPPSASPHQENEPPLTSDEDDDITDDELSFGIQNVSEAEGDDVADV